MSKPKTRIRLVACFGSIQILTAIAVLSYREEQQEQNIRYENYLVITPLWAPQGQTDDFAAFIEKIAKSIFAWKKIVYIPLEQMKSIEKKLNYSGLSVISSLVYDLLGVEKPDEIYLSRNWMFENQLLMHAYNSAEKICYGDGIGIYFSQSAFPAPSSIKNLRGYVKSIYKSLKEELKNLVFGKKFLSKKDFDIGYFSLPAAFGEIPPMKTVVLSRIIYLKVFQMLKQSGHVLDVKYVDDLHAKLQGASTSILLTSNFSEASGRMSLENEVAAYREFLETQGIAKNSILLIKPHPRDSKHKILALKSALSDLYSDVILLMEDFLFYLPFEVFFMEVFLARQLSKLQLPKIFTVSSACLTLEFLFNAQCIVGFGSDIVKKFFYEDQVFSRLKHEADLLSTIQEIQHLNASLPGLTQFDVLNATGSVGTAHLTGSEYA